MREIADKKQLRSHYKDIRNALSVDEKTILDCAVFERLTALDEYKDCKDLLAYVSGDIEVGTRRIIEYSLGEKRVLCPKCISGTNLMEFYGIDGFDNLEKGAYGISEPKDSCERVLSFERAVCLVPALSYDSRGFRLGFGKGYYDRFLENFSGMKIGLCYESCLSDILPNDSFDIKVDMLITDKNVIYFNK